MSLHILGPHPLERDEQGRPKVRIGTVFPKTRTVVTLPGIHATQRLAYADWLGQRREPPATREQAEAEMDEAVDFIRENDTILIRPDPDNMAMAFAADKILSELFHRRQIRFLNVLNEKVLSAIIELKTALEKIPEILQAILKVEQEIDTVVSVGIASKCRSDGSIPHEEWVYRNGFSLSLNGKTNLGFGRATNVTG